MGFLCCYLLILLKYLDLLILVLHYYIWRILLLSLWYCLMDPFFSFFFVLEYSYFLKLLHYKAHFKISNNFLLKDPAILLSNSPFKKVKTQCKTISIPYHFKSRSQSYLLSNMTVFQDLHKSQNFLRLILLYLHLSWLDKYNIF